ncbi:MAG: glycosyltransferase [Rhizobiales bacterium]|nr:glycosyltransferase [Hyphomicrobiales bacterium]
MTSVVVLSFSPIARDQRVLRQCALLKEMGHAPHVVAYADAGETIGYPLSRWPTPKPTLVHRLKTLARQLPAHLGLAAARTGFWVEPAFRWALGELERLRPQLVLANDWPALVVAAAWKARHGGRVHYDVHEFATQEFDGSLWWRMVYKPMVTQLERAAIPSADSVSTVGPGLAEAIRSLYGLAHSPLAIRSTPRRVDVQQDADCRWPMRVLYHGHLLPDRGLESLLQSVLLWREPHTLVIRGGGSDAYVASLKALVAGVPPGRVRFEPPVDQDAVIHAAAASADLGVFFTPLRTGQHHFNLPNKIFEYVAAGLAVAVSPGSDLRATVENYGIGVVSRDAGAQAIADIINDLTKEQMIAFKAAARSAALELCWETESGILRRALEKLLHSSPRAS